MLLYKMEGRRQGHNDAINYAYEYAEIIKWLFFKGVQILSPPEFCGKWLKILW